MTGNSARGGKGGRLSGEAHHHGDLTRKGTVRFAHYHQYKRDGGTSGKKNADYSLEGEGEKMPSRRIRGPGQAKRRKWSSSLYDKRLWQEKKPRQDGGDGLGRGVGSGKW